MKLLNSHTMIFGLKNAGKSNFVAHILAQPAYRNHLVFDINHEHGRDDTHRYVPKNLTGDDVKQEFSEVFRRFVTQNDRELRPDLFIAEEVSEVAPNRGSMADGLGTIIRRNRHYGVGFVGVARRPASVDTSMVELADNLVIYSIRGKNDRRRLNAEAEGLGDAARDLDEYEFLVVDGSRRWERYDPLPEYDTTGEL